MSLTNPVVDFSIDNGRMTFKNAAVDLKFAVPADEYRIRWATFDNTTGEATPLGEEVVTKEPAATLPRELRDARYLRAVVTSHHGQQPRWTDPVHVFFRKVSGGWQTVGLERIVPPRES